MFPIQTLIRIAEQPLPELDGVWLSVCVVPCPDGGAECRVSGELDLETEGKLRTDLLTALDSYPGGVTLDLSGVTFCDCTGLGVLLRVRRYAAHRQRRLRVGAVSRPVRYVLERTGTAPLLLTEGARTVSDTAR